MRNAPGRDTREPLIVGNAAFPVNKGALCIKGWTSGAALAQAFRDIRERYGADDVGIFGGGSLTSEKSYPLGKFARVALQTPNIDHNVTVDSGCASLNAVCDAARASSST